MIRWLAVIAALVICAAGCDLRGDDRPGQRGGLPVADPSAASAASAVQSDTIMMIDLSASFWPKAGRSVRAAGGPVQLAASNC